MNAPKPKTYPNALSAKMAAAGRASYLKRRATWSAMSSKGGKARAERLRAMPAPEVDPPKP